MPLVSTDAGNASCGRQLSVELCGVCANCAVRPALREPNKLLELLPINNRNVSPSASISNGILPMNCLALLAFRWGPVAFQVANAYQDLFVQSQHDCCKEILSCFRISRHHKLPLLLRPWSSVPVLCSFVGPQQIAYARLARLRPVVNLLIRV